MAKKLYGIPLQIIKDANGNTHPWYMSGTASIDENGLITTTTHLESHIQYSGFTGGMVAAFLNVNGQAVYTTPILQYGVDGYKAPSWLGATPSPRDVSASIQVDPSIYTQTDKITICLFHAPKNRFGAIIGKALPVILDIIKWIVTIFGSTSESNVYSSTSSSLISTPPTSTTKIRCAIKTINGNPLTIVEGGGLGGPNSGPGSTALHTDASRAAEWETFKIEWLDATKTKFALKTKNGNYVTAVNGGGIGGPNDSTCPVHTDATWIGPWERLTLIMVNSDTVYIQTPDGTYLNAANGGGFGEPANKQPIHTDATSIGPWETFTLVKL